MCNDESSDEERAQSTRFAQSEPKAHDIAKLRSDLKRKVDELEPNRVVSLHNSLFAERYHVMKVQETFNEQWAPKDATLCLTFLENQTKPLR